MDQVDLRVPRLTQLRRIAWTCAVAMFGSGFFESTSATTDKSQAALSIPERVRAIRESIVVDAKDGSRPSGAAFRLTQFFNFPNFPNYFRNGT